MVLRYGAVLALSAMLVAAQSRIIRPAQSNSAGSSKSHVATLRASDSPDGSRVSLSSDQSLNNYEAYRRGDRFYVRIPGADMPRAESIRGRGFSDVKVQRSGDSTVVSFRLQPGATAHVEQRSNRLEVVFTVPGGNTSANTGRDTTRPRSNPDSNVSRKPNATKPSSSNSSSGLKNTNTVANRNANLAANRNANLAANRNSNPATARGPVSSNTNTASKPGSANTLPANAGSKPGATPTATPKPSPSTRPAAAAALKTASPTPVNQPTPATPAQSRGTFLAQMKERLSYWILLAQLNPIPVATGVGVLLLIIALLVFQRRRTRGPRRVRPGRTEARKTKPEVDATAGVPSAASTAESSLSSVPIVAAAAAPAVVAATSKHNAAPEAAKPGVKVAPDSVDVARRERIAGVSEEIKNVMAGSDYDEGVIGSDDRDTRKLVGAELLAALVGRNAPRRQRARAAFMKHGYFDDATHDLRIAESSNERAAAARRLSFVHEREATPHLIGALDDPSPDVRRAAVEALMDLRDPEAIGPLNSLMQTENDRKVPRTLIKHAIDACATSGPAEPSAPPSSSVAPPTIPESSSVPVDSEREVIEL
jgi:hypothetical protein